MHAVKAIYRKGHIQLLSPLPAEENAELLVVVLDRVGRTGIPAETLRPTAPTSEDEFHALGMASFVDNDDDHNVDWEEVFDDKAR